MLPPSQDLDLNGAAVHLKPSHRLHAKVKLAVEQYERDYPGQVPVLSASAAGTSSSSSSKFELELQPEGGGKVTDAQRLQARAALLLGSWDTFRGPPRLE